MRIFPACRALVFLFTTVAITIAPSTPAVASVPDLEEGPTLDALLTSVEVSSDWTTYLSGAVNGALAGESSSGGYDAFAQAFDAAGTLLWSRQFGSSAAEGVSAARVRDNTLVLGGYTAGTFAGQSSAGSQDAFVRKYDTNGNLQWTRQFGSAGLDEALAITLDAAGNVFVAGWTDGTFAGQASAGSFDAFVRKYDAAGTLIWERQFGTLAVDQARFLLVDSAGDLYVSGNVGAALPGQTLTGAVDAFVRKYDAAGLELWTRQFGSSNSADANTLAVDSAGDLYVGGNVVGPLAGQPASGNLDVFVRKYSAAGLLAWTRQFGSGEGTQIRKVALDASAELYVTGLTWGAFGGQLSRGGMDGFVRKYDGAGAERWTSQFGTAGDDEAGGLAPNTLGSLRVMGLTYDSTSTFLMDTWSATMATAGSEASLVTKNLVPPKKNRGNNVLKAHHIKKKTGGYTPAQMQGLLQLQGNGVGQTIAIVSAMDSPSVVEDLNAFSKAFGLPAVCGTAAVKGNDPCFNFTKAMPHGQPAVHPGWSLGASAAVQWAHALAPMANILLVEAISNQVDYLLDAVDYAANQGASVISGSWGVAEFGDQLLKESHCALASAVCVIAAGSNALPSFPASSPFTIAVGGTRLELTNNGSVLGESAWSGGAGGESQWEPKPAYQGLVLAGLMRGIPDVAYNADPEFGFSVYSNTDYMGQKGWFQVGGTEMGAPQWAAIIAVANQLRGVKGPLSSATFKVHTALYSLTTGIYDVTTGSNPACASCIAGVGYDLVTGLGSPRAGIDIALAATP